MAIPYPPRVRYLRPKGVLGLCVGGGYLSEVGLVIGLIVGLIGGLLVGLAVGYWGYHRACRGINRSNVGIAETMRRGIEGQEGGS